MKRALFWLHRYLGIAVGWLMVLWCLSGLVMIYVSYPQLQPAQRLAALATLQFDRCCELPANAFAANQPMAAVSLEMLAGDPLLRVQAVNGEAAAWNLSTGQRKLFVSAPQAQQVAAAYVDTHGNAPGQLQILGLIEQDQWTVLVPRGARPLYYLSANDAAGTSLYVSSTTGELVQLTDRRLRFWNWLGSVPHWLYFAELRRHAALWAQIVIWSSVAGTLLAVFGLYLGVTALRRGPDRQLHSPFRGWTYWHHVPGLLFGLLLLGWVLSGLLSMNPWGWLASRQQDQIAERLQGEPPSWRAILDSLRVLPAAQLPGNTVRVESSVVNGQLRFLATTRSGDRGRYDSQWMPAPLSPREQQSIRQLLGEHASVELMNHEDNYYYSHGDNHLTLPVLRLQRKDTAGNTDYLDPLSGELLATADSSSRWYRWLHSGLHRMDFTPLWRTRPFWDLWMWLSLSGAALVCLSGTWLGIRHLLNRK